MALPPDHRSDPGEGASCARFPGACWRCAATVQSSNAEGCLTPTEIEELLRDLERSHVESLSRIRKLTQVIQAPIVTDVRAAQRPSCAAGDTRHGEVAQSESGDHYVDSSRRITDEKKRTHVDTERGGGPLHPTISSTSSQNRERGWIKINEWCPLLSSQARNLIEWKPFDYLVGLVILLNTIFLGLLAQQELDGHVDKWVEAAEHIFLVIYTLELIMRITGYGFGCLRDGWVAFDAALVCLGVFSEWIMTPIMQSSGNGSGFLKQLLVLRVLRLLRLLKALRAIEYLRVAWKLAYGLLTSGNTITSVFGLLVLALYVFALAGIEVITKDDALASDPEVSFIIQQHFSSVPKFLLTLTQFVLGDSVASLYGPLITAKPILAIYFIPIMLIISISLMNLVTAVIVEGALESAGRDKEMEARRKKTKVRKLASKFEELFRHLDNDDSGTISIDEVSKLDVNRLPEEAVDYMDADSIAELTKVFDADGSGDVSKEEFVQGMIGLCMSDVPKEMLLTLKLTRVQMKATLEMQTKLGDIECTVAGALANLVRCSQTMTMGHSGHSGPPKAWEDTASI